MSLELILWLSLLPVPIAMAVAWLRTRDPLHPLMYLGPMLFYVHGILPLRIFSRGIVERLFPELADVAMAQTYIILGVAAFCMGTLRHALPAQAVARRWFAYGLSQSDRKRLRRAAIMLGCMGLAAYLFMLATSGWLAGAYGHAKGRVTAASGYVTSAPFLCVLAVVMYWMAEQDKKLNARSVLIVLAFAAPFLIQGALGASRGPAFIGLSTIIFSRYLTRPQRPSPVVVVSAVILMGAIMMLLKAYRPEIYVGSKPEWDTQKVMEHILPVSEKTTEDMAFTWGAFIVARKYHAYDFGRRFFVHLFIRPIPRQIWPEKYEAFGLSGRGGVFDRATIHRWRQTVGWEPNAGSATGFLIDLFTAFSWGGLLGSYAVGRFYGELWRRSALEGGLWTILYFEACVVSVYLPTQGLASAWAYRWIYMAVITTVLWRFGLGMESPGLRKPLVIVEDGTPPPAEPSDALS